jgi:DNA end-binding protein Ku
MQAIWSGAISFGLVHIPVQLYSAVTESTIDFDFLRRKDLCPIKYRRVCQESGEEVPYKDLVRGYAPRKGEYVVLEDEDFKKANVKKTQSIEILSFADEREVDPMLLEKPYYIEPAKDAAKAYILLREAMKRVNKVGIARFVLKTREHLAVVRPEGEVLVLNQMRFKSEIRDLSGLELPKGKEVSPKEMEMAIKLIQQLTEPFKPEAHADTYTRELMKLIEAKEKGHKIHIVAKAPTPTAASELMAKLRASLTKAQKRGGQPKGEARRGAHLSSATH